MTRILALFLMATSANAQQKCGPVPTIFGGLEIRYGETIQSAGIMNGAQAIVTANPETGSWSWLLVKDGVACFIAAGNGWDVSRAPSVPMGQDS